MEENRFEVVYKKGMLSGCKIIVDIETGVNYLFAWDGNCGGLTVLVDKDGKPIVTPNIDRSDDDFR
ncbi:DUF6440 family protein [Tepidimicrobium xylanilyticum]|uniref:DUF6440 domain-containing protein n=1 Tax=Tepidimicrobium xylanilyticum TaxID=1123352 RepID=A0A1H2SZ13_9FIRM|nr:DUF6440 family protein [Tepidimicrobium xylanilyticum]GMG96068.1 hypothetical protein EN5CB1_08940 [Tepidimicrobium xylanilyticum]SDW36838.1 hypothetical protein SAMN05660923_00588 [Tepidimicrobium xylanilyticum]